jgi:hypothetical protein
VFVGAGFPRIQLGSAASAAEEPEVAHYLFETCQWKIHRAWNSTAPSFVLGFNSTRKQSSGLGFDLHATGKKQFTSSSLYFSFEATRKPSTRSQF